jgi:hypothetical protein
MGAGVIGQKAHGSGHKAMGVTRPQFDQAPDETVSLNVTRRTVTDGHSNTGREASRSRSFSESQVCGMYGSCLPMVCIYACIAFVVLFPVRRFLISQPYQH